MKDPKKVAEGKRSRIAGKAFEDRGYLDLEKKGWIVSRWMKNVELFGDMEHADNMYGIKSVIKGRLVAAKPKIRMIPGKGPMLLGSWTGFPDFIALKIANLDYIKKDLKFITNFLTEANPKETLLYSNVYETVGVEFKMDGKLDKLEKQKVEWLLANNIFSKVLIAYKDKNKRGGILYKEYEKA